MKDEHEGSENRLDDLTQGGLRERLWQRASAPAGVIDVRYAQQKYAHFMQWLAERTALLEYLRSRYAASEMRAAGERPFATPESRGQQSNLFSGPIQSILPAAQSQAATPDEIGWGRRPSGLADVLAAHTAVPHVEPEASPEERFRISRRPPTAQPEPAAPSSVASTHMPPAPPSSQPTHTDAVSPPSRSVSTNEGTPHDHAAEGRVTRQAEQGLVFQRRAVEAPPTEAFVESKATSVRDDDGAAIRLQPASNATAALPLIRPSASPADREATGVQSPGKADASPLPVVNTIAASPGVEPPLSWPPRPADVMAQRSMKMSGTGKPVSVVATEIDNDSTDRQGPKIVWRKPHDGPPSDHFNAPATSPRVQDAPAQSGNTASNTVPAGRPTGASAQAQAQGDPVRVEQLSPQVIRAISERVVRAITLDIQLERERRGGTKWR